MVEIVGYAAQEAKAALAPWKFNVRELRENDVEITVQYCGICHTDLHMIDNDWKASQYPLVPGHEAAGTISRVGSKVAKFKVGDKAGVGYIAWSCRDCHFCKSNEENLCDKYVPSYGFAMPDGEITRGGYAQKMVVHEDFAARIPSAMDLKLAAPLLCAGITCWSPMKHFGFDKPGAKIGVVGLGGLGHMAVQIGAKFGNEVTVISTSASKEPLARQLGASKFVVSKDPEQVKNALNSLDYIIDTVAYDKPMDLYLSLLKANGVFVTVGLPEASTKLSFPPASVIMKRKSVVGSLVGSIKEMEEMFEFCEEKEVYPMIELVGAPEINNAFDRLKKNDVKFRFVVDMSEIPVPES
eukprot:Gregarina_sp_Poly_1__4840@NODE_2579_length_1950_cov_1355_518322_g1637_i0_p1_GENE_NODE_2579_length_1950_cov_1355_518322_g1637_i0NODE_2579_length_1950_cov_1355_518322_g1637_i0_p1_ORF_typecomplete_len354_score60_10ADH_N/PF08240_12/3_4e31ADH_zinc_N/PF00107_26/1_2e22Glu_dehyd_C/PF16912_5/2_7e14AlaDh_PNT_C/PF01262_21/1_2e03AlaDh_PNT_C/PF01262_21/9_1e072Hacid_dh_C/PF02826_19/2e06ADH_zinc_N_2/PF13602_6/7_5e05Shikimate_DH/PF01488_20/0_0058NAD_binding_2/PF03446_15/0_038NAD_binding_10/PF13460_6/0_12Cytochr